MPFSIVVVALPPIVTPHPLIYQPPFFNIFFLPTHLSLTSPPLLHLPPFYTFIPSTSPPLSNKPFSHLPSFLHQ